MPRKAKSFEDRVASLLLEANEDQLDIAAGYIGLLLKVKRGTMKPQPKRKKADAQIALGEEKP